MKDMAHRVLMLRPMRTGVSGFASIRRERSRCLMEIRARGLDSEGFRAFLISGDIHELGSTASCRGEASLRADVPMHAMEGNGIKALVLIQNRQNPAPLLLGLLSEPETMTAARSACLQLCEGLQCRSRKPEPSFEEKLPPEPGEEPSKPSGEERLSPEPSPSRNEKPASVERVSGDPPAAILPDMREKADSASRPVMQVVKAASAKRNAKPLSKRKAPPLPMEEIRRLMRCTGRIFREIEGKSGHNEKEQTPREAYMTAIDPLPYVTAGEAPPASAPKSPEKTEIPSEEPVCREEKTPVDELPELYWPPLLKPLAEAFRRYPPSGRFSLPGWRFVCASRQGDGLWIGRYAEEGKVTRAAYVMGGAPEAGSDYQPLHGTDGKLYRALTLLP